MTLFNSFVDEYIENLECGADSPFVVGDDEDTDDVSSQDIIAESTVEHELEPYESMRKKISQLMLDLFPSYRTKDVKIDRMHDGRYSRIVAITLYKTPPKAPWCSAQSIREMIQPCLTGRQKRTTQAKQFVLRILGNTTQTMHHQVTTLAYLGYKLKHPVPKVAVFDAGAENALGHAYMLQERLPGRPLGDLWPTLNQAQRLSAVRAISDIVLDVRKIVNKCPGVISIQNTTYDLKRDIVSTETIPVPRIRPTTHPTSGSASLSEPQSTRQFLLNLCALQRKHAAAAKPTACNDLWGKIMKMVETLYSLALIPDTSLFHFHHGNFHPRKLLASITSESTVEITGILDWDLALFAPAFLSTRAPFFMWNGDVGHDLEDGDALIDPEDAELLEAKRTFESVVGESFLKEAYCPELVLARRLWHILLTGFENGGDIFLAEEIVGEFERLHPLT